MYMCTSNGDYDIPTGTDETLLDCRGMLQLHRRYHWVIYLPDPYCAIMGRRDYFVSFRCDSTITHLFSVAGKCMQEPSLMCIPRFERSIVPSRHNPGSVGADRAAVGCTFMSRKSTQFSAC